MAATRFTGADAGPSGAVPAKAARRLTTLAFVHGAWHAPWVFDAVSEILDDAGIESIAPDLPITDPNAGCGEYADAMVDAVGERADLVVVGHSAGGLTAPLVAERLGAARLVMVAPLVPKPGCPPADDFAGDPVPLTPAGRDGRETDDLGRTFWPDRERAIELLYDDCEPATAALAFSRLRPQGQRPMSDPSPLAEWPNVPTTYVVCDDDRMMSSSWALEVGVPRSGAAVVHIPGGHSPMLSRPRELAELLDGLTR